MAEEAEYVCPNCNGSGEVSFGHEAEDGKVVQEGMCTCWACNRTGHVGETEIFRHRLIVLARKLAERTVQLHQDSPLKKKAFILEGEQQDMSAETFTEVQTMDFQGHFETDLWKLRADLVETLFDLLAVPKPERWVGELGRDQEVPF